MEANIKTNDKNLFKSLLQFLKSLDFEIETKEEKPMELKSKKAANKKKRTDKEIREFYNSMRVDMSNYKFNREEANER
ncbi:MAG: hypothetical protein WCP52_08095 [Bacteroidota bacterium]